MGKEVGSWMDNDDKQVAIEGMRHPSPGGYSSKVVASFPFGRRFVMWNSTSIRVCAATKSRHKSG